MVAFIRASIPLYNRIFLFTSLQRVAGASVCTAICINCNPVPACTLRSYGARNKRPSNSFSHLVKHPQQPQTMITYAVFSNLLFTQCTRCKYWAENRPCLQTSKTIRRMCRPSRVSLYPMLE